MTRRVNIAVFDVLKSIVDSKVAQAASVAGQAKIAADRLPKLRQSLENLRQWEGSIARYETPHYDDGEETPADLEQEIDVAQRCVQRGQIASQDVEYASRFYSMYRYIQQEPKRNEIRKQLGEAEVWADHWASLCDSVSDIDDIDDMEKNKAYYLYEYERAAKRVRELNIELNSLRHVR